MSRALEQQQQDTCGASEMKERTTEQQIEGGEREKVWQKKEIKRGRERERERGRKKLLLE